MPDEKVCIKLRKMLSALMRKAYNKDLDHLLADRGQELWILGIDAKNKTFTDVCGTIDPAILSAIDAKGFFNTDAGYRADAQNVLPLNGKNADIFLLNTAHFQARAAFLEPIVVHELAHLLEHINVKPEPAGNDEANADAIMASLHPEVRKRHTREWALHLAAGGRVLLEKRLTEHKTIRAFLEAAIPSYDRTEPLLAKKGP